VPHRHSVFCRAVISQSISSALFYASLSSVFNMPELNSVYGLVYIGEKSRSHPHLDIINSYARDSIKQILWTRPIHLHLFAKFLLTFFLCLFPHPVSIPLVL